MICYVLAIGKQHLVLHMVVGYGIKIFWPGLFITSPDHLALGRHSAATRPPLGRYLTNTRPTYTTLTWSALANEFHLLCSTERGFQWLSSFFGNIHVFFPRMFFPHYRFYIRPSLLSDVAAFGDCCFRRLVILEEQKMI